MAEQEKWSNSIEAKLNKVGSSFEYLSSLLVNSEGLKTALNLISGLMDGITSLLKNIGVGKLAIGTLFTALISHSMGLSKAFTFNGSSLMAFGKQFNIFNKSLMQTNQTMNYSLGTFKSAGNAIKFYNQDTEKAIKFQQQMRDTSPKSYTQAYIQSLNGAKGSMQGYTNFLADTTYRLQGASGAIKTYNALQTQGVSVQQQYASALSATNPQLSNFLLSCNGSEASLRRFNITAAATKVAVTGVNIAVGLLKGVAIGLTSLLVSKIIQGISNFVNTSKDARKEVSQLADSLDSERKSLEDLKTQYDNILNSQDDELTKTEKLNEIKQQLIDTYDIEKSKIDAVNDSRREGTKLIDEEIRKQDLDYLAKSKKSYEKIMEETQNNPKNQNKYAIFAGLSDMSKDIKSLFANSNIDEFNVAEVSNSNIFKQYEDIKELRRGLQDVMNNRDLSESENILVDQVEETYNKLYKLLESDDENWLNIMEQHAKSRVDIIYGDFLKSNKPFDDVYQTSQYEEWYNKLKSLANDDFELKAIDNLLNSFKGFEESDPVETINNLNQALKSLKQSQSNFDNLSESITTASEALQNLNQTIDDNKNPEKFFSADEIIKLLDTYPELSNAILQTAYGYKIEQSALDNLKQAKLDEHKIALQTQLDESKSALASAKLKLSAYAQEIKGIQTVAQAKAKLAEMEIKYNNILAQTSSMQKNSFVSRLTGINGFANAVTGGYNAQKSDLENYIQAMQNVDDYQGTIDKLQTQINVLGTSFEDIKNDTSDTNDNLDKQKDIVQEMQDDMKDAQEKINDLVDLTVDMLKKQKELEKDNLKEQLDGFKKIIDKRKELIDLEKEQHDFENDIAEKNKSVSEIQQKIDNLSLDDSLEGNKKRSELNKELADEKKKLDDFLYENEVEKRKQALDTEEELYEEKINNQTKMIEEYLSKDAILRQDAINLINSQSQQFYNDLYNYTQTYTEMSEYEFNKLWNSAYNALRSYGNGQIDVLNILAYLDGQLVATEYQLKQIDVQVNAIKNSADSATTSLGNMADVAVQKLSNVNQTLASFRDKMSGEIETYNNNKSWSLAVRPDLEYLSKLPKFHSGGLVGGTSQGSEILAKLLTGEVVSTQSQAENFVSKTLPNLFQGAIKLSNNVQQSPNVSININVEGNADDTTINKLKSTIQNVVKDTFSEINGSKRRFGGTLNAIKY